LDKKITKGEGSWAPHSHCSAGVLHSAANYRRLGRRCWGSLLGKKNLIGSAYLFIHLLFVSGKKAHKHHKHEQKKTDRNTDMRIDRH